MKVTIEIEDNLQDILDSIAHDVTSELKNFINDNPNITEPPEYHSNLDHGGQIHQIVDGAVPTNTKKIKDLWYLYGGEFEEAFDQAGIGSKEDNQWPMGWKPAAIYCYLENKTIEWYNDNAENILKEFKHNKIKKSVKNKISKIKMEEEIDGNPFK